MPQRIILFTTASCPACRMEKEWLLQRGVEFNEYDIEDVEVQDALRELERRVQRRLSSVPITVVDGQVFEGFDPATMEQILS